MVIVSNIKSADPSLNDGVINMFGRVKQTT